jgi:cellulose synthase/poly-beta-1,6-N-acetylglucosamine synthase-like glycosyltransferase
MLISKFIFFLSLLMIFYIYLGYPILAFVISIVRNRKVRKGGHEPKVSILIAAYNEEDCIEATLINKLDLDYPKENLEIIVISDDSTDKTDHIVGKYEDKGVRLIRQEPRAGKTSGLNMAVPEATGEILVFSDANSLYARDALRHLVKNFGDPSVGYVTGKMVYTNPDGTTIGDGCTAYMKYENLLRKVETRLGSVVGVDGGIDGVRKNLYRPMNPDQLPDFVLPLKVVEQGYRVVYEPEANLKEPSLKSPEDEYRMRVRVSLRALWAMWDMRHLLTFRFGDAPSHLRPFSPSDVTEAAPSQLRTSSPSVPSESTPSHLRTFAPSALYAFQLWSHKVLRYLCFIFLITAYVFNLTLWTEGGLYRLFFILQNMAYVGAIASPILEKRGFNLRFLYPLNYFVLLNLASAHAFIKFMLRQKQVMWTPRKG